MQSIATCLMFVGDQCGRAEEAARLYASLFDDGEVLGVEDIGAGDKRLTFRVAGRDFIAMDSGAPHQFGFTPALSLFVDFDSAADLDRVHAGLAAGGVELMPLGAYDFSPRFAWLNDRFGVSWQLRLVEG